ncbi:MAG: diaminopimelate decarboxylase, partial [Proteobacteria bacterium]|nr:diaminopimelate decarboxylase [Pseudomonadota bacterium]
QPVKKPQKAATTPIDIVGPICETGDFLAKDCAVDLAATDLVAIASAGAYGMSMSSNYNSRGRAAEVFVQGDQARVVRERESIDAQLAPELAGLNAAFTHSAPPS